MHSIWMKTLVLAAGAAVYSHAIFGIGGQWAPSLGLKVKGDSALVAGSGATAFSLRQGEVSGLQGFGFKVWIDALPFIDLEAGSNFQFGMYDLDVIGAGKTVPVEFDLDLPFIDPPGFARIVNDLTILYPFLKLPPLVSIVKISAGAGMTYVVATEVLNSKFAKKAVAKAEASGGTAATDTPEKVAALIGEAMVDEGLKSGVGFHLQLGAKAKPPILPIAVFANMKYHFLSTMPSAVDANSMTMELGAALAF